MRNPGLLQYFLGNEVVGRVTTNDFSRHGQWYGWIAIYAPTLLIGTLPWTPALLRWARALPADDPPLAQRAKAARRTQRVCCSRCGCCCRCWCSASRVRDCRCTSCRCSCRWRCSRPRSACRKASRCHAGAGCCRGRSPCWRCSWRPPAGIRTRTHRPGRTRSARAHRDRSRRSTSSRTWPATGCTCTWARTSKSCRSLPLRESRFNPEYDESIADELGGRLRSAHALDHQAANTGPRCAMHSPRTASPRCRRAAPYEGRILFRIRRPR